MSDDGIRLRGPASIWYQDAGPDRGDMDAIRPGGHIQSGVKGDHEINSVWIRVHAIHRNTLDDIIFGGPGRRRSIRFRRRGVWQML